MRKYCRTVRVEVVNLIMMYLSILMVGMLIGLCIAEKLNERDNIYGSQYVKIQDRISMDWSTEDNEYLLKIAELYGGTEEDRAYNIIVTLNRTCNGGGLYGKSVKDVVINQFIREGKSDYLIENIEISEESIDAMEIVVLNREDNTQGSYTYRNCR